VYGTAIATRPRRLSSAAGPSNRNAIMKAAAIQCSRGTFATKRSSRRPANAGNQIAAACCSTAKNFFLLRICGPNTCSRKNIRKIRKTKASPSSMQNQSMVLGENIHQGIKVCIRQKSSTAHTLSLYSFVLRPFQPQCQEIRVLLQSKNILKLFLEFFQKLKN